MTRTTIAQAGVSLTLAFVMLLAGCSGMQGSSPEPAEKALPADPNALILGAEVALQRQHYREASRAYVRAAQLAKDEALAEQATRIAYEHQQWTLVLAGAERWLELNHTNEEARRFAAFASLNLYQIDRATEHVAALLDSAFINPQAGFLALLPQLSQEGTAAATTAVLKQLVGRYESMTEAHYALGRAALQSDNFALAYEHAQKAHELGPYWMPAGLLLAQVQLVRGETDTGLAAAKKIVEQDPQDTYRLEYALMLLQAGKDEEGRKALNELAESDTASASVERTLADIDFQMGDRESSAQRYANLVSSGRFVYESLFYLGAIAESRESWDEAVQIYARVTGGEFAMTAQSRAARIKADRENLDAGLKLIDDFAQARPQYAVDAVAAHAALLGAHKDHVGALTTLEAGLREYPDSVKLRFARVFQLEAADRVKDTIAALRGLAVDRPGDPAVTNALGYTLVDRTKNHREGLGYIEQALTETPDDGAVLDSMGWALHRLDRNEEALKYLERAHERINDADVELHVAEVLLALKRTGDARAVLDVAVERYPENEKLASRRKSLAK
jgi:tetratricopeptide (TPR) repeat protein